MRSRVCDSEIDRVSSVGAAPKTTDRSRALSSMPLHHRRKEVRPVWATRDTHERSWAGNARYQGRVVSR